MMRKKNRTSRRSSMLPLTAAPAEASPAQTIAISAAPGTALTVSMQDGDAGSRLKSALEDDRRSQSHP